MMKLPLLCSLPGLAEKQGHYARAGSSSARAALCEIRWHSGRSNGPFILENDWYANNRSFTMILILASNTNQQSGDYSS